jgi:hypothetical protein
MQQACGCLRGTGGLQRIFPFFPQRAAGAFAV